MKDLSSLSETIRTNQYRMADVAFFPVGGRRVLTCVRGTETMNLLQKAVANLLKQCRDLKTIDEHVEAYCQKLQLSGTMLQSIRYKLQHQLQHLAQQGYLISSSQLLENTETTNIAKEVQPHTSYLICTTPRSGSTLLCEALKNTGLAGQPEEYFFFTSQAFWKELWGTSSDADYVARAIKEGTTSNGVFGAKMMWRHVDTFVGQLRTIPGYERLSAPEFLSTVFPNLRYIFMTRSDKVRQAVSLWKACQTNIWAVMDKTSPDRISLSNRSFLGHHPLTWMYRQPFTGELHFDFESIDASVREIESQEVAWQKYFAENGITPFTVVYEDLVAAYEQTAIQILKELAIPVPESLKVLPCRLKQQADALSEEWVQRYYEELSRK